MFTKCMKCEQEDTLCILKLLLLPFPELIKWIVKTKKSLGWTIQVLSEKSGIPAGTISRIISGEADCKYSTMICILLALLEGLRAEFPCPEFVPTVQHLELLAQQAEKLQLIEKENDDLRAQLAEQEARHRSDVRAICAKYQEQLDDKSEQIAELRADKSFYKEQLKALQSK